MASLQVLLVHHAELLVPHKLENQLIRHLERYFDWVQEDASGFQARLSVSLRFDVGPRAQPLVCLLLFPVRRV